MNVVVTGASKGIGLGIAEVLAENGHHVGLLARSNNALESICQAFNSSSMKACFASCDIRDYQQVNLAISSLASQMGGIDALINNAGTVFRKSIQEITIDQWQTVIETNLNGTFYAIKAALSFLTANSSSSIINISSISGRVPLPGGSAYAASKYAITGLSESIFSELRDFGVRVTTVFPGSVETDSALLADYHGWKVTPREIGSALLPIIESREQVCINRIEIRPAKAPNE